MPADRAGVAAEREPQLSSYRTIHAPGSLPPICPDQLCALPTPAGPEIALDGNVSTFSKTATEVNPWWAGVFRLDTEASLRINSGARGNTGWAERWRC